MNSHILATIAEHVLERARTDPEYFADLQVSHAFCRHGITEMHNAVDADYNFTANGVAVEKNDCGQDTSTSHGEKEKKDASTQT